MSKDKTALSPTNAAGVGSSWPRFSIRLGGAIIVLAALAVYHNSFAVPLLLDDVVSIKQNLSIRSLWPVWRALSPPITSLTKGRPVLNFSFAVNYALGGASAWGYHALNLAIHVLAALTLFGIVRRTLSGPVLRERFIASAPHHERFGTCATRLALAVAVLWAVHPLQTEAVTYISERCESLMGLFYLLTLYCFIRGAESAGSGWWFTLSAMACALGMASKEVMVTAPVMVLLYDRTFVSGSFPEAWRQHRRLYLGLGSTWLLLGWLMVGLQYRGAGYGLGVSWWTYALIECRVLVRYLGLAVWPHPLVFDYGDFAFVRQAGGGAPDVVVLFVLAVAVLIALWRRPVIGFIGAWFFLILAPTSSVVPVTGQPMAEHRMYLSLAAVVALAVVEIHAVLGRRDAAVFLALAVVLGFLTTRRNEDFRSDSSIWEDTVAKRPDNLRALIDLGVALEQEDRIPEAIERFEHVVEIKPDDPAGHLNLGDALRRMGHMQEAIAQYEMAVRVEPNYTKAYYDLGLALWLMGRSREAIDQYREALRIDPAFTEAHVTLGIVLSQIGSNQEALAHFTEALRLTPDSPEVHCDLGFFLLQAGRLPQAVEHFEQALRIEPDYVQAHFNLGLALEKLGRTPEAIEHYQQALKLRPDYAPAKNALTRLGASQ